MRCTIHVSPHAHPTQALFPGRFGGQNHVIRSILTGGSTDKDHALQVMTLGRDDRIQDLSRQCCLIEVAAYSDAIETPDFLEDLQRLSVELLRHIDRNLLEKKEVEVIFHYWDGAYVFDSICTLLTARSVPTGYVTHSLQASHLLFGLATPGSPPEYALASERSAITKCGTCWVMSPYEAELVMCSKMRLRSGLRVVSEELTLPTRTKLPLDKPRRDIAALCHGRSAQRKNYGGFIEACKTMEAQATGPRLAISVNASACPGQRSSRLSWHPIRFKERNAYLRDLEETDVVIVPSYYEPFGLIALEAFLAGKILVAPRKSGAVSFPADSGVLLADTTDAAEFGKALCLAAELAVNFTFKNLDVPHRAPDYLARVLCSTAVLPTETAKSGHLSEKYPSVPEKPWASVDK